MNSTTIIYYIGVLVGCVERRSLHECRYRSSSNDEERKRYLALADAAQREIEELKKLLFAGL